MLPPTSCLPGLRRNGANLSLGDVTDLPGITRISGAGRLLPTPTAVFAFSVSCLPTHVCLVAFSSARLFSFTTYAYFFYFTHPSEKLRSL